MSTLESVSGLSRKVLLFLLISSALLATQWLRAHRQVKFVLQSLVGSEESSRSFAWRNRAAAAAAAVVVVSADEDESPLPRTNCTSRQVATQVARACDYYGGRHNLPPIFPLLREHLPAARVLVDVGANKGLVSARWLELWRPGLAPSPRQYAMEVVDAYWKARGIPRQQTGSPCGVTDMCQPVNQTELDWLNGVAPIPDEYIANNGKDDPLVVHSFEPSVHNYEIHTNYLANLTTGTTQNERLKRQWKWHRIAASDVNAQVYFSQFFHEGSKIDTQNTQNQNPNTRAATLDTLAMQDKLFNGNDHSNTNSMIDILKIDAESVDAQVLVGATQLLLQNRVRVVMWETPNAFPLHFTNLPSQNEKKITKTIHNFSQLVHLLDQDMNLSCYFPGRDGRGPHIKLTGCNVDVLTSDAVKCGGPYCPYPGGCSLAHSNALCVNRKTARSLYQALEEASLATVADDTHHVDDQEIN